MTRYFEKCKTAEDLKKIYHMWALKLHPDKGGNLEEMKILNCEYEEFWERLKDVHQDKDGRKYKKETSETSAEFMEIIEKLINLADVDIEICGSWIWVSGDTRPHREILKKLKFRWSPKKSAWYYHREPYRKRSRKELSLDEIRGMYGSQKINKKEEKERIALLQA